MARRRAVNNSAKCEGCVDCEISKINGLETVHCNDRNRDWIFGQVIEPCEFFRKKGNK